MAAKHLQLGKTGEKLAEQYLQKNGYQIIHKNYRLNKDEADIICRKNNSLIFVEVKTRSTDYFQNPFEAVTLQKQKRLIRLANNYVEKINSCDEIRFDVISIIYQNGKTRIEHIKDAFQA